MEYNQEVVKYQFPIVQSFVEHLAFHRGLFEGWDRDSYPSLFWGVTTGVYLDLASIAWCKVFGAYSEDIHWTKVPTSQTAEEAKNEFRTRVREATGLTQEEWQAYHQAMVTMRNESVAHLELREQMTRTVPSFDQALTIAYVYEEWVKKYLMQPYATSRCAFPSIYEDRKAVATEAVLQWQAQERAKRRMN